LEAPVVGDARFPQALQLRVLFLATDVEAVAVVRIGEDIARLAVTRAREQLARLYVLQVLLARRAVRGNRVEARLREQLLGIGGFLAIDRGTAGHRDHGGRGKRGTMDEVHVAFLR